MIHYVYRLQADTGEYYFGSRSSKVAFNRDRYMGSGVWCRSCKKSKIPLFKTLVSQHKTRESAAEAELEIIAHHWGNPLLMNRARMSAIPLLGPRAIQENRRAEFITSSTWRLPLPVRVLWVTMMALADATGLVWVHPGVLVDYADLSLCEFNSAVDCLLKRGIIKKIGEVYAFVDFGKMDHQPY